MQPQYRQRNGAVNLEKNVPNRYTERQRSVMPVRLLIAEDELDLAEVLTVFFEKNHFAVDTI